MDNLDKREIEVFIDGETVLVRPDVTVAAALLREGWRPFRYTVTCCEPRSLFCGMGVCMDCLLTIDGRPGVRACVTRVRPGMRIDPGKGAITSGHV